MHLWRQIPTHSTHKNRVIHACIKMRNCIPMYIYNFNGIITVAINRCSWLFQSLLSERLAIPYYWLYQLYHTTDYTALLAIPHYWLYHTTRYTALLAIPHYWLYHTTGYATLLAMPHYWLYHTTGYTTLLAMPHY